MTVAYQKGTANYVPAAAVIRRSRALSGFIGRKASAGGLISLKLKAVAQPSAVGDTTGITKIDDVLMGEVLAQLPHAGQAAQAAVEHADGAIIHAAFPSFPAPVR